MKSDPTNRSLRPFRPDARRSDRKTPIRTERLSADFPAGGADTCESESRSTSGTIPIRRTGSADLFRTACALLFLLPLLSGCDDIFEQDIDRARIEVVAPKHDAHIEAGEVTFLWRPLSGARNYRLTVVSPSFARASRVWADTTLRADSLHAADRFSLTLDEGDYQWSLQAFNGVYRSEESVYSLRVDPAAADESQSLSDPQEPAEEGDDMHEAFAVPGREGLSGSDGLAMPNPSTESAGASGLSVRTVRRTDSSPAVAGMGCFRSRIARHGRLFQVSRSGRPKDDCRRRATAGCGLPVRHGHSAPICYRRKNAFQVTKLFPSHEIPSADIPVTRRSARYLGRRGVEALFLRAETCGFRSGCRARCPEQSPCGHRYAATRLSRSVPACGCDETFRPGVRFGKSARTVESEERTSCRQARLYGPYP